jgi:hypothetical protein
MNRKNIQTERIGVKFGSMRIARSRANFPRKNRRKTFKLVRLRTGLPRDLAGSHMHALIIATDVSHQPAIQSMHPSHARILTPGMGALKTSSEFLSDKDPRAASAASPGRARAVASEGAGTVPVRRPLDPAFTRGRRLLPAPRLPAANAAGSPFPQAIPRVIASSARAATPSRPPRRGCPDIAGVPPSPRRHLD